MSQLAFALDRGLQRHRQFQSSGREICQALREYDVTNSMKFARDVRVTSCRRRLAFEGAHLTTHFANQIAQALEVLLGLSQTSFGALLAPAVLQDARGLFNDGPSVLGTGIENGVELSLTNNHVLMAPDARIAE